MHLAQAHVVKRDNDRFPFLLRDILVVISDFPTARFFGLRILFSIVIISSFNSL